MDHNDGSSARREGDESQREGREFSPDPLAVAGRGLAIFPLPRGGKVPALTDWPNRCIRDLATIRQCWPDGANIGVGCKANHLLGLDLDRHHTHADGIESFSLLCQEHGEPWPETLTVRTPSGGLHLYFRAPRERALGNTSGKLGRGIDTRGPGKGNDGGYLVGPGSLFEGRPYTIARSLPIAALPGWIAELLDPPLPPTPAARSAVLPVFKDRYVNKVVAEEVQRVMDAGAAGGGRNDALNLSAYYLGKLVGGGMLAEHDAEAALYAAAEAIGLVHHTGERQVRATIRSGLTAGAARPRVIASRRAG